MNTNPVEVKHNPVVESAEARHSFRQEIERALDRLVHGLGGMPWQHFGHIDRLWPHGASVTLAIDVTENDKAYTVSAELPGIGEKDVHVTVRDRALLIEREASGQDRRSRR
jgi:HSP20 family protein